MAKLLAFYTLCPVNDSREFLGVTADAEDGSVINTLGRNIVIVTKLSDQKQIRSWTVLDKLSNRVVYDGSSGKYVGVFGKKILKCWTASETNLKKVKKIKLQKNVSDLVTFGEKRETLVVFEDGSCAALSALIDGLSLPAEGPLNANMAIESPKIFPTPTGELLFVFFTRDLATDSVELRFSFLEDDSRTLHGNFGRIKLNRGIPGVKLVGYEVTEGPMLVTIWSDRRIFRRKVKFDEDDTPGQFTFMLNAVSVEHPLSIVSVSKDYLAIYGANVGQEGASLILYNFYFNVIQAKQFFKVYFGNSRLSVVGNNILLAAGQVLAVVPFRIPQAYLADMVGSQKSPKKDKDIARDYVNEDDELEKAIERDSQEFAAKQHFQNEEANPEHGKDSQRTNKGPSLVASEVKMDEKLSALRQRDIVVEFLEIEDQDGIEVKVFTNPNATTFSRDEFEFLAMELEASGASELEISSKIITLALSGNVPEEAQKCLRRYSCIPEEKLVSCLVYAMKKKNWDFLITVLSVDFSHEDLVGELRNQLKEEMIYPLMKRLLKILESKQLEEHPTPAGSLWDGDARILEWFSALLDAHFQHLVMRDAEKTRKCLEIWKKVLTGYWRAINEANDFSATLRSISNNKAPARTQKASKWYSIDLVQLY
uniref:Putative nucleolar protein 11 n=1 Tax=Lutzomyia longipalpis TaxID=7200 RepID=A0A7G3ASX5_LUTLO